MLKCIILNPTLLYARLLNTHKQKHTHTLSHTHWHMLHINIQQTLRSSHSRPHHLPALIVTINYLAITHTHTLPYTHARAGQYISIGLG